MDAFDADVLIYAAAPTIELGTRVRQLFDAAPHAVVGVGSVMLIPELTIKPTRLGNTVELDDLYSLLGQLSLRPVDEDTVDLSVALGARYGIKTVDAVHLATAVLAGADRFVTNNRRDFTKDIVEIDVTYPDELPDSG